MDHTEWNKEISEIRNSLISRIVFSAALNEIDEIRKMRISLIPIISFMGITGLSAIIEICVVIGSFVSVWGAWVEVEGLPPKVAFSPQMCGHVNALHVMSLRGRRREIPHPSGSNMGRMRYNQDAQPGGTSHSDHTMVGPPYTEDLEKIAGAPQRIRPPTPPHPPPGRELPSRPAILGKSRETLIA